MDLLHLRLRGKARSVASTSAAKPEYLSQYHNTTSLTTCGRVRGVYVDRAGRHDGDLYIVRLGRTHVHQGSR